MNKTDDFTGPGEFFYVAGIPYNRTLVGEFVRWRRYDSPTDAWVSCDNPELLERKYLEVHNARLERDSRKR